MNQNKGNESIPVSIARKAIEVYLRDDKVVSPQELPVFENDPAGRFVSLHAHGVLRGCIGTILPTKKTVTAEIVANAISACSQDPRFDAVRANELDTVEISVDILSKPETIESPDDLDPKKYGVIITSGVRRGLLLPDLEGVESVYDQIAIARRKGGIESTDKYEIQRFTVTRYT